MNTYILIFQEIICPIFVMVTGAFLGGAVIKWIYQPRVKVKLKRINNLIDKNGEFISFNVVNLGSSCAMKCISYITIDPESEENLKVVSYSDASINENLPEYSLESKNLDNPRRQLTDIYKKRAIEQIQLCWTHHGNPFELDINPGVTRSIDICRFQITTAIPDQEPYWIFPTEDGWRVVQVRVRSKIIKGKIFICPSNSYPLIADFVLKEVQGRAYLELSRKLRYKFSFYRKRILLK